MKSWLNRIGLSLMAASAAAMIAADAFAEPSTNPFAPTGQKLYLGFSVFAPADLECRADGPGVRTKLSRNIAGKPLLRITGNVKGATITCTGSDGSQYTTDVNRRVRFSASSPVYATVYFNQGSDAMSIEITRDNLDERVLPTILPRAFVRVK